MKLELNFVVVICYVSAEWYTIYMGKRDEQFIAIGWFE